MIRKLRVLQLVFVGLVIGFFVYLSIFLMKTGHSRHPDKSLSTHEIRSRQVTSTLTPATEQAHLPTRVNETLTGYCIQAAGSLLILTVRGKTPHALHSVVSNNLQGDGTYMIFDGEYLKEGIEVFFNTTNKRTDDMSEISFKVIKDGIQMLNPYKATFNERQCRGLTLFLEQYRLHRGVGESFFARNASDGELERIEPLSGRNWNLVFKNRPYICSTTFGEFYLRCNVPYTTLISLQIIDDTFELLFETLVRN